MKIILDHKTFFEKHGNETIVVGIHNTLTVDMLYQLFRDRLKSEMEEADKVILPPGEGCDACRAMVASGELKEGFCGYCGYELNRHKDGHL